MPEKGWTYPDCTGIGPHTGIGPYNCGRGSYGKFLQRPISSKAQPIARRSFHVRTLFLEPGMVRVNGPVTLLGSPCLLVQQPVSTVSTKQLKHCGFCSSVTPAFSLPISVMTFLHWSLRRRRSVSSDVWIFPTAWMVTCRSWEGDETLSTLLSALGVEYNLRELHAVSSVIGSKP